MQQSNDRLINDEKLCIADYVHRLVFSIFGFFFLDFMPPKLL